MKIEDNNYVGKEKSISEIEWRLNRSVETSNLTYPDLDEGDEDE